MKRWVVALFAVFLICILGPGEAQTAFRGQYEIQVSWGSSSSRITSSYAVGAGEAVEVTLDEDVILLAVQPALDSAYDLHVTVKRDPGNMPMALVAPVSSNVRRAAFGEAIELTESSDAVTLPGGAVVSVLPLLE